MYACMFSYILAVVDYVEGHVSPEIDVVRVRYDLLVQLTNKTTHRQII